MPFHGFESFEACVLEMTKKGHSEESARKICGALQKDAEMADFNAAWVEIFRTGDYGQKGTWTEADIDKVVSNFASGIWKPPAVIGHPETNSPAMGWVKELQRQGKTLLAKFNQVQPELEALVSNGRYPNRSAAFYTDPQGKGPVLRHVGFVGATPPEVKGLAPVRFASDQFTEVEFTEDNMMEDKKGIKEAVQEFFSELFGKKPEHVGFSEAQVQNIVAQAVTAATAPLIEQNKAFATQFTEMNNRLAASNNGAIKARVLADITRLKAANKWVPAYDANGMAAFMETTALANTEVSFGEPGKETKIGSYDALVKFLEAQKEIVPTGNIAGRVKTPGGKVVKFNEAKGVDLDMESVALNERAEKIAAERKIDFGEALRVAAEEVGS